MSRPVQVLPVTALTRAAFAPFGDVIEASAATGRYPVNEGTATRFHDLATIDTGEQSGHPVLSLFRAEPRVLPFDVAMLERHPLGSQAFVPMHPDTAFVVVVASAPDAPPQAFLASRGQGINYRRGTWHHPLIALAKSSDFLVIDRGGEGCNCEEIPLKAIWRIARIEYTVM